MNGFIQNELEESRKALADTLADQELQRALEAVITASINALRAGNRLYFAGNGGSAADAQHFAAELVSRFYYDRPGLAAEALTTDTSILTAIGNDYGYDRLFARQLEAKGRKGDIFVGITTSGSSPNIFGALKAARAAGMITVALTGLKGRGLGQECDYLLVAPSSSTPKIQEVHGVLGHILCAAIEREIHPQEA